MFLNTRVFQYNMWKNAEITKKWFRVTFGIDFYPIFWIGIVALPYFKYLDSG